MRNCAFMCLKFQLKFEIRSSIVHWHMQLYISYTSILISISKHQLCILTSVPLISPKNEYKLAIHAFVCSFDVVELRWLIFRFNPIETSRNIVQIMFDTFLASCSTCSALSLKASLIMDKLRLNSTNAIYHSTYIFMKIIKRKILYREKNINISCINYELMAMHYKLEHLVL